MNKTRIISRLKAFWGLLKQSAINFSDNDDTKFSASLSYYTIFSIAPMLIIAISIGSYLFGRDAIEGHLFRQINGLVGNDTAKGLQDLLRNIALNKNGFWPTLIGVVTLFIGATGVFGEIQSTINRIWGLKAKPRRGVIKYLVNRVLSFAMVVTFGFLLIVSLIASTLISMLNEQLNRILPDTAFLVVILNNLISLLIISLLFTMIFKFLPDSLVRWKDAFIGSLFTSLLFFLGKFLISLYLSHSSTSNAYGAAGSMIILLLWVYYSALLLYFGAEFTKEYALRYGYGIKPNRYAIMARIDEKQVFSEEELQHAKKA